MASNVTKAVGSDYRGIAIPATQWKHDNFAPADSVLTQANPRPGVPVAQQITDMVLETSGNMPNIAGIAPSLTLTTVKGGNPGVAGARFTFTPNHSIPAGYQTKVGWEAPNAISRVEVIDNTPGVVTHLGGCITLQSNTVLLGGTISNLGGVIWRKTFDAATYASSGSVRWVWGNPIQLPVPGMKTSTIQFSSSEFFQQSMVSFLQLPEGRVHAYSITTYPDQYLNLWGYHQVTMYFSDDDGATWTLGNESCLSREIFLGDGISGAAKDGFRLTRIRTAYVNGQALMLIGGAVLDTTTFTYRDALFQYASSDLGTGVFSLIDISGGTRNDGALIAAGGSDDAASGFDICVIKDSSGFGVSYARIDPAAGNVGSTMWKELGTAYTSWITVDATLVEGGSHGVLTDHLEETQTTCAVDDSGTIWISWEVTGTASSSRVSYDGGVTWTDIIGQLDGRATPSTWWDSGDVDCFPTHYCSTFQCGRWVFCSLASVPAEGQQTTDLDNETVWEIDQGGYSTVTRPHKNSTEHDDNQITWDKNWVPFARMTDMTGWVAAGAGTETLQIGQSQVVCAGGQTKTLTNTTITAVTGGFLLLQGMCEFQVTAGTSRLEVLIGDGVNAITVRFQFSTTNFTVIDTIAGATLLNVAAPLAAGMNQVYFGIRFASAGGGSGNVACWYRESAADWEIRPWKLGLDSQALAAAASVAVSRVRVDQPASSTSNWKEIHWVAGVYGEGVVPAGLLFGAEKLIYGRAFSGYPTHVYAGDGVRVRVVDGPTWGGNTDYFGDQANPDQWVIAQRHEYGVENLFADVSPSPRRTWRSTSLAQQDIVVTMDRSNDPTPLLGRVLVVGGFNANFKQLDVAYRTVAGGAYTALGTLDFSSGQTGLRWVRDGHVVRPDTSTPFTAASDYFTYNILEDSHVLIKEGANLLVRTILTNGEGSFTDTATVRTRLYCPDILGTEDVSGTTGEIWSKDGLLIIHDMPDVYQLKFTIPTGLTAEGYFELGTLFVGHLAYFGKQYARGRALLYEPNYNLTTNRGGTRRAALQGPTRRGVEFNWANENETDTGQITSSPPNADYILSATGSTDPVATPADTSYKMAGLVEALRGAVTPCIYLSKIPIVSNENVDTVQVNRNLFMLGRLTGNPRTETVLGNEWGRQGELVRIATVPFEEEV